MFHVLQRDRVAVAISVAIALGERERVTDSVVERIGDASSVRRADPDADPDTVGRADDDDVHA